jgi:hypothetical protein
VGALAVIVVVPVVLLAVAGGRRPRGEDVGLAASGWLRITVAVADTRLDLEHPDPAPHVRDTPDGRDGYGIDGDAKHDSPAATVTRPPGGGVSR